MFFDTYDTPVFRPPSEARSFILRVTRGCAHNKCTYCNMYRGVPFQILKDEEYGVTDNLVLYSNYGEDYYVLEAKYNEDKSDNFKLFIYHLEDGE